MVKRRVHEVAKELNIESKEIISKLSGEGIIVKSHMSSLEDSDVERLMQIFSNKTIKEDKVPESASAAGRRAKPENKKAPVASEKKKVQRAEGRPGDAKKSNRTLEQNFLRGPGLVDRVPSRPPDRRFEEKTEKPGSASVKNAEDNVKEKKESRTKDNETVKVGQNSGNRPRNRFQGARNDVWRPEKPGTDRSQNTHGQQQNGYRQGRPVQNKPQNQNRQYPNKGPVQQTERSRTGTGRYVDDRSQVETKSTGNNVHGGGQRWSDRQNRAGGNQPGVRPKPGERPAHAGGSQGLRPKMDTTTAAKPQVRYENKDKNVGEKAKFQDKPKTAVTRQPNKGRFDKRASTLGGHNDKSRTRNAPGGGRKRGQFKSRDIRPTGPTQPLEKKPVIIGETVTVQEMALKLYKTPAELIKKLMTLGVMATINQEIDSDTATLLAVEYGFEVEIKLPVDLEAMLMQEPEEEDASLLTLRPCIVTVMGHVDHGKTSLLDAIRQTNVIATEAGGITQHIGAYQVEHAGKKITFVDTPGHEAFTAMRARGAQVTDIAILVVAAEDGVMPQTVEAINHAQEAGVPIIVAINKMDKPDANPERVKQELTEHGLIPEQWGGDTICVNVSAVKREGLTDLLEMILLVAEMKELKANPDRAARGTVIEAELDKGRRVKKAGPSTPVEVLGFSEAPMAGDVFIVVQDEKIAKNIVTRRQIRKREEDLKTTTRISLDDLFKQIQEGQIKEMGIIVKADVQGSVEVLKQALERLNTGEVKVNIIHGGVGAITETDIMLASASNAIIIGFNVRPDAKARKAAEEEKVDVRLYRVIYEAIEDVKAAMGGLLDPEYKEISLGRAEIRKIFKASKIGTIAGCYVLEGKIERSAGVRLVRDGIVIHEGKLDSLKRFKDDAKEVVQGYECGLAFEKFNEMHEGDIVEAFTIEAIKRELA